MKEQKLLIIIGAIIFFISGIIVDKTFSNFKVQKLFNNIEENKDVIFAFYQDDEEVGTMPSKDDGYAFNASKSICDNEAKIKWDSIDWRPSIKNLNKSKTKCNLYFSRFETLRKIGYRDTTGMWGYKDKLTKLVIEPTKNKKVAGTGQIVHGPYDESNAKNSSIESYVVCDAKDSNCIGYLQGEGGIKLNSDSSCLFSNFQKVTQIEGIENLDTSNVTNMHFMFYDMDLIQYLDLSTFDTSNVTDMSEMFESMGNLEELDLSSFDTRNVIDMEHMFYYTASLTKITYGPKFLHTAVCNNDYMFESSSANRPDENVNSSWGN